MAADDPMIRFRAPQELKDWLEQEANANGRSMNAELVWMINYVKAEKESFEAEERTDAAEAKRIAEEAKRIAEEALKIAKEAQIAWQYNALMTGIYPPKEDK